MIVVSVLLVLGAGVLLGLGLVHLDEPLLYSSIGVSALAALALVVGVRRLAAVRAGQGLITVRPAGATLKLGGSERFAFSGPATGRATPRPVGRATPPPVGRARVEPSSTSVDVAGPAEHLADAESARLGGLETEVMVVDGLPCFHLSGCSELAGDGAETLPVAEAVQLGFSPCGRCRAGSVLLRAADGQ